MKMSDSSSVHQKSDSFSVTQRLLDFLDVLRGQDITIEEIEKINEGELDIISGLVISRNYKTNGESLEQVTIKTESGKYFTLSNNKYLLIDQSIVDFFRNSYLINRPKEIGIINLNTFENIFRDAANYRQYITSIYNRISGEISVLSVDSRAHDESKENIPKIKKSQENEERSSFQPYPIEVRYLGDFSANQKAAFAQAANRWGTVIQDDLPTVKINGEEISGVVVTAIATKIDGPANRYGQAGPTHLRPKSLLPAGGIMEFDTSDLAQLEEEGKLVNVVIHEMGHVLGIGNLWEYMGLIQGSGTKNPTFIGQRTMCEYAQLIGEKMPIPVPIENIGDEGTREGHWRESIFGDEVMTSYLDGTVHLMSRITVAALQDMGYSVNFDAADQFFTQSYLPPDRSGGKSQEKHCKRCSQKDYKTWAQKAVILTE